MRQLILVNEALVADSAALAAGVGSAPLGETPIIALDAAAADFPAQKKVTAKPLRDAAARPWIELDIEEFRLADGRKVIVANHHDGAFPKTIDRRTRSLLTHCDMLVARCPPHQFLSAVRFYEPSLFAINGLMTEGNVVAATGHLTGLIDRLRAGAADRRHRDPSLAALAPLAWPPADEVVLGNTGPVHDEALEEGLVFETRPGSFPEDAARAGFGFIAEKVRFHHDSVTVMSGASGIAMFGPYLRLEAGRYRLHVSLDGAAAAGIGLTLEAVWGGGGNSLAAFVYRFEEPIRAGRVVLAFEVSGSAAQQPLEFRLWNAEGGPAFRLTAIRLTRALT
jgi:hypothetical protein